MSLLQFERVQVGQVGLLPGSVKMLSTDSLAIITTVGYINPRVTDVQLSASDLIECLYNYNQSTGVGTYVLLQPSISNGAVTLVAIVSSGNVLLPVISGDYAIFNGTSGQIKDSLQAASNAALGFVVNSAGGLTINHIAQIADANGSIKDGGVLGTAASKSASNAALSTLASTAGSGFTAGHIVTAADAAGTIQDSGVILSSVQLSANIKANRTANIGGGGAGPISVVVAGVTAASIITGSIQTSSNPVDIQKITATATGFDILFSGDPGATCTVNYVAFVVAQ